jgi:AcrR family transcriptional regulator
LKSDEKQPYHHGDLRNSMLEAADEILHRDGLPALTLRACARAAGVSHAAPAHHFGDLRGLLTALSADSFTKLGDATEAVRAAHRDTPGQAFGALGLAYASFARAHPDRFRLMMRHDLVQFDDPAFSQAALRCFTSMTNIIAMARGESEVTLDDMASGERNALAFDVVMTWSLIHGFAHLRTEGNFSPFVRHMGGDEFDDVVWEDIGRRIGGLIAPR